jgi:hypothetical protein
MRSKKTNLRYIPCRVGDEVWFLKLYHTKRVPTKGYVSEIKFVDRDMRLLICVAYVGRGEWNKQVFATQEEALKAIEAR